MMGFFVLAKCYYEGMHFIHSHKVLSIVILVLVLIVGVVVIEFLIIKYNGRPVAVPEIPRGSQSVGTGKSLKYIILGDSTGVGQGGDYAKGIAVETAGFLAGKGYTVQYQNFAVSGARTADVLNKQVAQATVLKPDVVLIAMGANDVTHLTRLGIVQQDARKILDILKAANPAVKIVLTGSPEMGSVPRFPQPVKYLAKVQTNRINAVLDQVAKERGAIRAHIAEETGPTFMKHPELFAQDKFHPRNEGYAVWFPVLNRALAKSLE